MSSMSQQIGFIGNPMALPFRSQDNSGNIIHGHAARALFQRPLNISSSVTPSNLELVKEKCSHIAFVTATTLHTRTQPAYIDSYINTADFIEKAGLPVCTFGLGCQATLTETIQNAKLDPRSARLLQVLSAHSNSIAVRGHFTADLCAKYGIKNVTVVGCQSAYISGFANWDAKTDIQLPVARPAGNFTQGVEEREILRLIMSSESDIIGQNDRADEAVKLGEITKTDYASGNITYWTPPFLARLFEEGKLSRGSYFDYVSRHFHKFYDVPTWLKHMRSHYDFCFGTRFHGNMAAFEAGVPALWIMHDMRTKELCEHLHLPHVPHADLVNIPSVNDLAAHCSFQAFWQNFPRRVGEFDQYLTGNGIAGLLKADVQAKIAAIAN